MTISANDVKTKGVTLLSSLLNKFVVIDIDRYNELRAMELDMAYMQTKEDLKSKNYKNLTAKEYIEELLNEL